MKTLYTNGLILTLDEEAKEQEERAVLVCDAWWRPWGG